MSDETEGEYRLSMPFVLTQSNGGPYDDATFVAGWNLGHLDQEMRTCAMLGSVPRPRYLPTRDKPQIDLLAMKHGYIVYAVEWETDPTLTRYDFDYPSEEPPGL